MKQSRLLKKARFSTKVLAPVVSIMVLSLLLTTWLVNRRITRQFEADAARSLETADSVFKSSENLRAKNLLSRFGTLPNDARYKSAFQSKHPQTVRDALKDLPNQQNCDVALFTSTKTDLQASAQRDPNMPLSELQVGAAAAIKQALTTGAPKADTVRVGNRLFDVVCVPVFGGNGVPIFGGGSTAPIGVLTIGSEVGDAVARELSQLTQSQIVLLANGRVVASALPGVSFREQFAQLFNEAVRTHFRRTVPRQVVLGEEHFVCKVGPLSSLSGDSGLGYLLLSSYEQPLRALHSAQLMVLAISGLVIVLGSVIVGLLVRKVTEPLRHLQVTAEAVGRGDFSRQVEIVSEDECGELASAFNVMTSNLKRSREELEKTVGTLKSTQAQLIQTEKLSGLGEFVAGVAHELNNPLTSVMGFSELLVQAPGHPKQERYLDMIYKSSQRCQKIVQSLLAFARRHPPERKLSNVNTLVESSIEFMQYQFRTSNIQVVTQLDPNLPESMLDGHQLQQVFMNILNNARQAIDTRGGAGRVQVTTENLAPRMRITFEDNGAGIPEEHLSKLFIPFFTTKEIGQGTGLGLSFCYGVVSEHGGTIQVQSKVGQGSTFVIDLPLIPAAAETPVKSIAPRLLAASTSEPSAPIDGHGKRVLVIDDEEGILEMVRGELTQHGYEVDVASDGEAALRRLTNTRYDLALCDWKMPGLSGGEVYDRLLSSNPELCQRFVFITGDVISERVQLFLKERQKKCLLKPFSLAEFRGAVEEALSEK